MQRLEIVVCSAFNSSDMIILFCINPLLYYRKPEPTIPDVSEVELPEHTVPKCETVYEKR